MHPSCLEILYDVCGYIYPPSYQLQRMTLAERRWITTSGSSEKAPRQANEQRSTQRQTLPNPSPSTGDTSYPAWNNSEPFLRIFGKCDRDQFWLSCRQVIWRLRQRYSELSVSLQTAHFGGVRASVGTDTRRSIRQHKRINTWSTGTISPVFNLRVVLSLSEDRCFRSIPLSSCNRMSLSPLPWHACFSLRLQRPFSFPASSKSRPELLTLLLSSPSARLSLQVAKTWLLAICPCRAVDNLFPSKDASLLFSFMPHPTLKAMHSSIFEFLVISFDRH